MHLIQLLLPIYEKGGKRVGTSKFKQVKTELTRTFGGLTIYSRAPAHGLFKDQSKVVYDEIVIVEVMVKKIDKSWWATYRKNLERQFHQDILVVRASKIRLL